MHIQYLDKEDKIPGDVRIHPGFKTRNLLKDAIAALPECKARQDIAHLLEEERVQFNEDQLEEIRGEGKEQADELQVPNDIPIVKNVGALFMAIENGSKEVSPLILLDWENQDDGHVVKPKLLAKWGESIHKKKRFYEKVIRHLRILRII